MSDTPTVTYYAYSGTRYVGQFSGEDSAVLAFIAGKGWTTGPKPLATDRDLWVSIVADATTAQAAAAASASEAAAVAAARFDDIADLAASDALTDGEYYTASSAFNGEPETFLYDADSTATADGALIVDATGMGAGRLVSTRSILGDISDVQSDNRTFPDDTLVKTITDRAQLKAVPSGGAFINAAGQGFTVASSPYFPVDPRHYGAKGDGVTDDYAVLSTLFANEEEIDIGIGVFRSSGELQLRDGHSIQGARGGTTLLFDDGTNGIGRASTDVQEIHLRDFKISRSSSAVEQTALDLDNMRDGIVERIEIENFSRVISNMRTADGAYCWRNTFSRVHAFQCKEYYYSPHVIDGATYRANENLVIDGYAGDVGRWSEHTGLTIGGIGNLFLRMKLAQSGTNTTGAGIYFGEFSSNNELIGVYHEGSYPYLWSSDITSIARKNNISSHHTDTTVGPTIDDPIDSVSYERGTEGAHRMVQQTFGTKGGQMPAGTDATATLYGDTTRPAIVAQARDNVASTDILLKTADTDAVGARSSGFKIVGQGLAGGGAGRMQILLNSVARWRFENAGDILPEGDATQDIGSSSKQMAQVHTVGLYSGGNKVVGTQQAAIADITTTATTGALPTATGSHTIADAAAPTNDELLRYCVELEAKIESLLGANRAHGLIDT